MNGTKPTSQRAAVASTDAPVAKRHERQHDETDAPDGADIRRRNADTRPPAIITEQSSEAITICVSR